MIFRFLLPFWWWYFRHYWLASFCLLGLFGLLFWTLCPFLFVTCLVIPRLILNLWLSLERLKDRWVERVGINTHRFFVRDHLLRRASVVGTVLWVERPVIPMDWTSFATWEHRSNYFFLLAILVVICKLKSLSWFHGRYDFNIWMSGVVLRKDHLISMSVACVHEVFRILREVRDETLREILTLLLVT